MFIYSNLQLYYIKSSIDTYTYESQQKSVDNDSRIVPGSSQWCKKRQSSRKQGGDEHHLGSSKTFCQESSGNTCDHVPPKVGGKNGALETLVPVVSWTVLKNWKITTYNAPPLLHVIRGFKKWMTWKELQDWQCAKCNGG